MRFPRLYFVKKRLAKRLIKVKRGMRRRIKAQKSEKDCSLSDKRTLPDYLVRGSALTFASLTKRGRPLTLVNWVSP